MAQTIAVQRGTTSVTSDGTSRVTLFTQSSGTATRVILVGLSMNMPSGTSARISMVMSINVNGAGNYLPVAFMATNGNTPARYLNMFGNATSTNNTGALFSATSPVSSVVVYASTTDGGYAVQANINTGLQVALPNNSTAATSTEPINQVPSQFWMASGDLLTLSCYSTSAYTANIIYHFVTVTES